MGGGRISTRNKHTRPPSLAGRQTRTVIAPSTWPMRTWPVGPMMMHNSELSDAETATALNCYEENEMLEKDWTTEAGLRAVVLTHTSMGYRMGYVAVGKENPAFG